MKDLTDYDNDFFVYENECIPDPSIQMRCVRVVFHDSRYNYQTDINGTRAEVANYFRGASLNVASYPFEIMRTPVRLEFDRDIGRDDGETQTVAVEL